MAGNDPSASAREVLEPETVSCEQSLDELISAQSVDDTGSPGDRSGQLIHDRYRLLRMLGRGDMGTVYLAQQVDSPHKFLVKLLDPRYAARTDVAAGFLQEAEAVSRIEHDNILDITDFGTTDDGVAFLVTEQLRGESLAATCKREAPLSWARARHIMTQLCRALQAAHEAGVVHRNLGLDTILRSERNGDPDFIEVLDFGLAKLKSGGVRLTRTGAVLGSPNSMAPEQARSAPTDARTDVYAAGVVLYALLCGHLPFFAKSFVGMRNQHLFARPEPPSTRAPAAGITHEMDAVVLRALAKEPRNRFESIAHMQAAIEAVGTGAGPVELLEGGDTREDDEPPSFDVLGNLVERSSKFAADGQFLPLRRGPAIPAAEPTAVVAERRKLLLVGAVLIASLVGIVVALYWGH